MVELKTIHIGYLSALIHEAFKGDWQLINTFHLINGNLADCVRSTFQEIMKVEKDERLEFYGIYSDGIPVGFTVVGDKFLLSFGIAFRYRTKEIVLAWWKLVCELLNHEFATWLFRKNTRAIDFLKRQGMIAMEDNSVYITLVMKKESICQQEVS